MKTCIKCKSDFPEDFFPRKRNTCKDCKNKIEKERRAKNRAHSNKINKESYYRNKKTVATKEEVDAELCKNIEDISCDVIEKKCTVCGEIQNLEEFYFHKQKGNYRSMCKTCSSKKRKTRYENNKEHENKINHKRIKERMKEDPVFKLERYARSRIYVALTAQGEQKSKRTWKYIGCTKTFFCDWIEYQLTGVMTLENYGKVWHVDHVKPCASYDLSDKNQVNECFNWKNCRPMLGKENLEKSDKIDKKLIKQHYAKAIKYENEFNNQV